MQSIRNVENINFTKTSPIYALRYALSYLKIFEYYLP